MANTAITRERVHTYAEACSDEGDAFQPTALRLTKQQRRVVSFFERNTATMGPLSAQVGLYMLTVSIRVFERVGGRLKKVSGRDLDEATARVEAAAEQLFPADEGFAERAKAIAWRAQPHLLDEILWALYEREELKEEEVDVDPEASAMIYVMLWVAIEALDANWTPPADFEG